MQIGNSNVEDWIETAKLYIDKIHVQLGSFMKEFQLPTMVTNLFQIHQSKALKSIIEM